MQSFLFSQNLIQETIKCFKEENGIHITPEQANEYLSEFAGLFLAFADKATHRPAPYGAGGVELVGASSGNSDRGVSNTTGTL